MPTNTDVTKLKINSLTEAQFDAAVQSGVIGANEISFITDLDETIQVNSLPTADVSQEGKIYQYIGATNQNYTNGYFYKCIGTTTPSTVQTSTNSYNITSINVNIPVFETQISTTGTYEFIYDEDEGWSDSNFEPLNLADYGITYEGTPVSTDNIIVDYTAGTSSYAWEQVEVQPAGSSLPDQTGQSGKFLTTDGTDASWSDTIDTTSYSGGHFIVETDATHSLYIKKKGQAYGGANLYCNGSGLTISGGLQVSTGNIYSTYNAGYTLGRSDKLWYNVYTQRINNGSDISVPTTGGTMSVQVSSLPTAVSANVGQMYQYIGATDANYTNGYFYKCTETLSFVGPAEDATEGEPGESMVFTLDTNAFAAYLQTKSIVLAGQTTFYLEEGTDSETGDNIYILQDADAVTIEEFSSLVDMKSTTGITWGGQEDLTGDFPYLAENATGFVVGLTYAWAAIDVQAASGGSSYTAGNGISIDANNEISVADPVLVNNAAGSNTISISSTTATASDSVFLGKNARTLTEILPNSQVCIGQNAQSATSSVVIGSSAYGNGVQPIAIGASAHVGQLTDRSIALGHSAIVGNGVKNAVQIGTGTNSESGTFYWGTSYNGVYVNYKLVSADGTIPEARLADTTSAVQGQVLTLNANGNAEWANPSTGGPTSLTVTLQGGSSNWTSNTQTVTVQGVTATNTIFAGAAPASVRDYDNAGIICVAQNTDELTFECMTVPTNNITVNVLIIA